MKILLRNIWKPLLAGLLALLALEGTCRLILLFLPEKPVGPALNRLAWEAGYRDHGLPVPEEPREGYWGSRILPYDEVPFVHWRMPERDLPGRFVSDSLGLQYFGDRADTAYRILIIGGSVAQGAYASSIERTYQTILQRELARRGLANVVATIGAGAWKSEQECIELMLRGRSFAPHLVVAINGLNDLTLGAPGIPFGWRRTENLHYADAPTLMKALARRCKAQCAEWIRSSGAARLAARIRTMAPAQPVETSPPLPDLDARVASYLHQMRMLSGIATAMNARTVVVLQPALSSRARPSAIEKDLLAAEGDSSFHARIRLGLDRSAEGLERLTNEERLHFIDARDIFANDERTVFADLYHFGDPGHEIMGMTLADRIEPILRNSGKKGVTHTLSEREGVNKDIQDR